MICSMDPFTAGASNGFCARRPGPEPALLRTVIAIERVRRIPTATTVRRRGRPSRRIRATPFYPFAPRGSVVRGDGVRPVGPAPLPVPVSCGSVSEPEWGLGHVRERLVPNSTSFASTPSPIVSASGW